MNFQTIKKYHIINIILFSSLAITSCKQPPVPFKQPKILDENTRFDFAKITFKEDVRKLISKVIDNASPDYSNRNYDSFIFPEKTRIKQINPKKWTYLKDTRYLFENLNQKEAMAQFAGVLINDISFEADENFNLVASTASSKFFNAVKLDAFLLKMYQKFGKTSFMQEAEKSAGLIPVLTVSYDANNEMIQKESFEKPKIDFESYLYEYKNEQVSEYFHEWILKDKVIQLEISVGHESTISTSSTKIKHRKYFRLDYIVVKRDEYNKMDKRLAEQSIVNKYPMRILKPYHIDSLNFYLHYDMFLVRFPQLIKK